MTVTEATRWRAGISKPHIFQPSLGKRGAKSSVETDGSAQLKAGKQPGLTGDEGLPELPACLLGQIPITATPG